MSKTGEYSEYLEKYAKERGISEREAQKHAIVREYAKYLREKRNDMVAGTSDS